MQSLASARGRLGYALTPNWLIYGTGGYAGGELRGWDALAGASGASFLSGWSAGAGLETLLYQNVSLKFEYLHVDLGHASLFNAVPGVPETVGFSGDVFRVGLDYRFNWSPTPAASKPYYTK